MENHSCNTPNRAWWVSFSGSGRVHHSRAKPKTGPGNLEHWCGVAKLVFFLVSLAKIPKTETTSSVAYVNFGTGHMSGSYVPWPFLCKYHPRTEKSSTLTRCSPVMFLGLCYPNEFDHLQTFHRLSEGLECTTL